MPIKFSDRTSIPADGAMNGNLSASRYQFMIDLLGIPDKNTENCSHVTNPQLKANMVYGVRVAPNLRLSGLAPAVESVREIFRQVKEADPRLYNEVKTAGMLCCRLV